jgi:two-component system, chemotaxis family, protein-glutamate methylesterase/glutaminase
VQILAWEEGIGMIRVLIIDDSATIRALMREVLDADPAIIVTGVAASAEEAEQVFDAAEPDVVTLDVAMPGLNGLDYLDRLVARRQCPVIMLSGRTAKGELMRYLALRAGAAACFDKRGVLREKAKLIKLIKDAAAHRLRLSREDRLGVRFLKRTRGLEYVRDLV